MPLREGRKLWQYYAGTLYDRLYELLPLQSSLAEIVDVAEIERHHRVLDAGSGTGFLLRILITKALYPTVYECDGSRVMLRQARKVPYGGLVRYRYANLNLPLIFWRLWLPFDRIIFSNSLYPLKNPKKTIKRAASRAKKSAILVISTPKPDADPRAILMNHLQRFADDGGDSEAEKNRLLPILAEITTINEQIIKNPQFHYPTEDEIYDWFRDSGWNLRCISSTYADQNWLIVAERIP